VGGQKAGGSGFSQAAAFPSPPPLFGNARSRVRARPWGVGAAREAPAPRGGFPLADEAVANEGLWACCRLKRDFILFYFILFYFILFYFILFSHQQPARGGRPAGCFW